MDTPAEGTVDPVYTVSGTLNITRSYGFALQVRAPSAAAAQEWAATHLSEATAWDALPEDYFDHPIDTEGMELRGTPAVQPAPPGTVATVTVVTEEGDAEEDVEEDAGDDETLLMPWEIDGEADARPF